MVYQEKTPKSGQTGLKLLKPQLRKQVITFPSDQIMSFQDAWKCIPGIMSSHMYSWSLSYISNGVTMLINIQLRGLKFMGNAWKTSKSAVESSFSLWGLPFWHTQLHRLPGYVGSCTAFKNVGQSLNLRVFGQGRPSKAHIRYSKSQCVYIYICTCLNIHTYIYIYITAGICTFSVSEMYPLTTQVSRGFTKENLVVDLPLWKMMEFVSWDYDIPTIWKKTCSKPPIWNALNNNNNSNNTSCYSVLLSYSFLFTHIPRSWTALKGPDPGTTPRTIAQFSWGWVYHGIGPPKKFRKRSLIYL